MLGTFRGTVNFDSGDGGGIVNYTSNDYDVFLIDLIPLEFGSVFGIQRILEVQMQEPWQLTRIMLHT